MKKNQVITALILLVATFICIFFIDRPLAVIVEDSLSNHSGFFTSFLTGLETITGFNISRYLLTIIFLLVGIFFLVRDKMSRVGYIFLYITPVHFFSRLIAGILKNVFDRPRPYQFLEDPSLGDLFAGGSSFPSGHIAHFFSLFLPIVLLFPRKLWWLLIIPLLVLIQRVVVNDHYLGDTLASLLIVYLLSILFQKLYVRFTTKQLRS